MKFTRYGVYYTAPNGAFANAGADWLGWDIATGTNRVSPHARDVMTPRKYGFHGTIKPPFRISKGFEINKLQSDLEAICADEAYFSLDGLKVTQIGKFLALTPVGSATALAQLASRIVKELDPYRAPPKEAELVKRRRSKLTAAQEANLSAWGYPYVLDEFRFHMTLSGAIEETRLATLAAIAETTFADVLPDPFVIDAMTLCGEAEDGQFHAILRVPLSGQ